MVLHKVSFEAIGTKWSVDCSDEIDGEDWERLQSTIQTRIAAFDQTYSRFRADSWVSSIATQTGSYMLPEDAYPMLKFYKKLYLATDGKVTPLIGSLLEDVGYDTSYSLTPKKIIASPPAWEDSLHFTKGTLTLRQPVLLDFGAAGKGYLVDIVASILESLGIKNFTINAGGDMLHRGKPAITIGLENPTDTSEAIGTLKLQNQSLCASSIARRQWRNYHHIMDPYSALPAQGVLASWVIADDTMTADGLATALFFMQPGSLLELFNFEYGLLTPDMGFSHSKGFPANLFTEQPS